MVENDPNVDNQPPHEAARRAIDPAALLPVRILHLFIVTMPSAGQRFMPS